MSMELNPTAQSVKQKNQQQQQRKSRWNPREDTRGDAGLLQEGSAVR